MTARTDMLEWIRANGAAIVLEDGGAVPVVWAYPSGNDTILVTADWLDDFPSRMPFHRRKGAVTATDEGWTIGTGNDPDGDGARIAKLSDGFPDAQAAWAEYQAGVQESDRTTDELEALIQESIKTGWV